MTNNSFFDNFHSLAETENIIIGHVFETAYIIEKRTNKKIDLGDFYGDPTCALISPKEDWYLVGGENLILWRQGKIFTLEISDIFGLRQIGENLVEVLIDPWSENSAIWRIDITTCKLDFVRTFDDYKDKEYSERIEW